MPNEYDGEYDQQYDYHWYYVGTGWQTKVVNTRTLDVVWQTRTQWNEKQSRPFPTNPLKSITALPRQYKRLSKAGSTGVYLYDDTSSPSRSPIWKEERRHAHYFIAPEDTPDTSDWITPLRIKIKNEAINLGVTLAEYRQSVNMFGSAAKHVVNSWRKFRRTSVDPRKKKNMCSVASAELIYTYGVEPLLSDLYDSVEELKLRLGHPVYRRYHARSKDTVRTEWDKKYPTSQSWASGGYTGWSKWDQSKDIVAYVWFDLEKANKFILGNPAELIWEVIPYSFVVDWMLPIGDWLIAIDALRAVDHMRVSISQKDVKEHRLYLHGRTSTNHSVGVTTTRGTDAKAMTYKLRSHERFTDVTLPLPTLPKFELSGSVRRLMNAMSLLVNARGCKGKTPRYTGKLT